MLCCLGNDGRDTANPTALHHSGTGRTHAQGFASSKNTPKSEGRLLLAQCGRAEQGQNLIPGHNFNVVTPALTDRLIGDSCKENSPNDMIH